MPAKRAVGAGGRPPIVQPVTPVRDIKRPPPPHPLTSPAGVSSQATATAHRTVPALIHRSSDPVVGFSEKGPKSLGGPLTGPTATPGHKPAHKVATGQAPTHGRGVKAKPAATHAPAPKPAAKHPKVAAVTPPKAPGPIQTSSPALAVQNAASGSSWSDFLPLLLIAAAIGAGIYLYTHREG